MEIRIYSKKGCHLCEEAKSAASEVAAKFSVGVREVDIEQDPELFEKYHTDIPVIFLDDRKLFKYHVDKTKLAKAIRARIAGSED